MEYLGPIVKILKSTGTPVYKNVEYHRKLEENMNNLTRLLQELNSQKKDVEELLRKEHCLGKLPKEEVNNWLKNIESIDGEVENIKKEVDKRKFFSLARLSKLLEEKIQEVKEYQQKGSSFMSLAIDAPPARGLTLRSTSLEGENTQKYMKEIWDYLMGNEVTKIGVCGIGGMGKTTIITHINNRLLQKKDKFDSVIWITVSQPFDLKKLQGQIASKFSAYLTKTEDEKKRAGLVLRMFEGKRFVLLLDDIWEAFSLEEAGIPEPTERNGCKLVITTRSLEVCNSMGCKVVKLEPLPKNEALKLFVDKVGLDMSNVPTLKQVVELVVEQCSGLPLALVTVASCMRMIDDIHEWRNALIELSKHIESDKNIRVIERLQFSYDRLKDENMKRCFLYCALYPEDFKIEKHELIDYWIVEGLVDDMDSYQATYDRGHSILNRLLKNCLLQSGEDDGISWVKMHDLVRDMALHITSKSPLFMIKAGMKLQDVPSLKEWKENLQKVSLMRNDISEIPLNMSPKCEALSTLLLQCNPLKRIPESFFAYMPSLMILDLSHTGIDNLPNSVSDLRNLTGLLLKWCLRLKHVPSLAKLLSLRSLNLEETDIDEVPAGIEMLEELRYLNLYSRGLDKLPTGILSKLFRLQKLRVHLGSKTLKETAEEAARLRELDSFEGHFYKIKSFNLYVKSLESRGVRPKTYILLIAPTSKGSFVYALPGPYQIGFSYLNLFLSPAKEGGRYVILCECMICKGDDSVVLPKDVQNLTMISCNDVISLTDVPLFNRLSSRGGGLNDNYSDLRDLNMSYCGNLKKLFSPELVWALQNLESIEVFRCDEIEEIIALDDVDNEEKTKKGGSSNKIIHTFPNLRKLTLYCLPKLKSICSNDGVMVCNSLQDIQVLYCPNLKRLPLSLSPANAIKQVEVEKDWWESLEWDDNAKEVLEPHCNFGPHLVRF